MAAPVQTRGFVLQLGFFRQGEEEGGREEEEENEGKEERSEGEERWEKGEESERKRNTNLIGNLNGNDDQVTKVTMMIMV